MKWLKNNKIKTVEDALTLEFESKEDIRKYWDQYTI